MSAHDRTVGTTSTPVSEPVARVGRRWSSTYALVWLGVWMAQLAPVQYLLPLQVEEVFGDLPDAQWKESVLDFGLISGVAAIFSLVAYPLTGALSDRTTARMGRRRPWIIGGAALFGGSLVLLSLQHSLVGVTTFWSLAMVGFCAMSAGLTALISDQVPVTQRGWVSGLISAPQAVGVIVGVLIVTAVVTGRFGGYVTIAVLLGLLTVPFVASIREEQGPAPTTPLTFRSVVAGFWISPRQHPDFGWTLLSRVLVNVGNALATSLLFYFLLFGLDRKTADDDILVLSAVYAVTSIVAALVCGPLSDRLQRRKPFVLLSAAIQVIAGVLIATHPSYGVLMVTAALSGLGYGAFLAVDQALATQVLPDAASRGKELGIMNIASAIPQSLGPLIGALIVSATGGFGALFLASGLICLLGALAVLPIRSVR